MAEGFETAAARPTFALRGQEEKVDCPDHKAKLMARSPPKPSAGFYVYITVLFGVLSLLLGALFPLTSALVGNKDVVSVYGKCPPNNHLRAAYIIISIFTYSVFLETVVCFGFLAAYSGRKGVEDALFDLKVHRIYNRLFIYGILVGIVLVMGQLIILLHIVIGRASCDFTGGVVSAVVSLFVFCIFSFSFYTVFIFTKGASAP